MKDKTHKEYKDLYQSMFLYLAEATTVDYALNMEYEYGVYDVMEEAIKLGYKEV